MTNLHDLFVTITAAIIAAIFGLLMRQAIRADISKSIGNGVCDYARSEYKKCVTNTRMNKDLCIEPFCTTDPLAPTCNSFLLPDGGFERPVIKCRL